MPKAVFDRGHTFLAQPELLSFEEITRLARLFVTLGVTKLRITGGEPLLRKNVEALIAMLAALRTPSGDRVELTLTTNGSLLAKKARALRDAGLQRIAISLDAIEDATFRRMNDVDFPLADVLEGIAAATEAGFGELKVNMVVRRGVNDGQILPMASHFRGTNAIVRFIEFMDVGQTNGWRMDDVLPSAEVVRHIDEAFGLEPLPPHGHSDTSQRWRYKDGSG
jgi:cyclic pyranopterin phosphate synthase